ncbi:MAG: metallophosphoesterase [Candidatus Aureabacteria bacterium]|nr:metallophosphoesterase [Candidatus Auribacterota bacterium]
MNPRKYILPLFTTISLAAFAMSSSDSHTQDAAGVVFAVIGDYGEATLPDENHVANLIKGWNPVFIVTAGDNNYPNGTAATIDANIGQYFHEFIYPYTGSYGEGATENLFFPTLGNHDWKTANAQPYLDYFTLPGNERYYDFTWGPVHFFMIDSDTHEPDGTSSSSVQGVWLQNKLASSTARWKLVVFHHAPYSSGTVHGSTTYMRWPFQSWGANAVLSGHEHTYERVVLNGFPYFVNGLGGNDRYSFGTPVSGSEVRYNSDYGAMQINADDSQITFQFISQAGAVIDTYSLSYSPPPPPPPPTPAPPAIPCPIALHMDKEIYATSDSIAITADACASSNVTPYVRFVAPGGVYYYLTSTGALYRGSAGSGTPYVKGPVTLDSDIRGLALSRVSYSGVAPGSYALQGAFVDRHGLVGTLSDTTFTIQ